ncbi:MAG: proline dehydrogenase family protein [Armatimonadota bacterium]|nr:proline dehydrogenase family protein [Armatimonadota bacterium]
MAATSLFRKVILVGAHSPRITAWVRRYGMRLGAARFVAGETLDECVRVLRQLNDRGLVANTTLLGEAVKDPAVVASVVDQYVDILERLHRERLRCNVALKLTHLGLDLGEDLAYAHVGRLVRHAAGLGNFIRIDMEESSRVDATLRIYRRLRADGLDNVGTVLQSYLYRTGDDLTALLPLRPNLRLVKGAYLEPPTVAYPRKADVDRSFVRLAERMLREAGYSAIATHDDRIIDHVIAFARREGIPTDRFEFQMLYGVRPQLQRDLVAQGYRVLVATPFGRDWYPYFMRRLAERPANVLFILRNLVRG